MDDRITPREFKRMQEDVKGIYGCITSIQASISDQRENIVRLEEGQKAIFVHIKEQDARNAKQNSEIGSLSSQVGKWKAVLTAVIACPPWVYVLLRIYQSLR